MSGVWPRVIAQRADQPGRLDPFDGREPGRCAVVVESRLNPVRFDGDDVPSIGGAERLSQRFLTDGVRASIGTIITEAQHIHGSVALGYRRQTGHVSWPLVAVEGMEQSAVQHRLKPVAQTLQMERVGGGELDLDSTAASVFSGGLLPAIASAVSATSTPRTGNPSEAMRRACSPVPQPASSTLPANPPLEAIRTIAGCGRPISHGAGPSL